jgi:hypothetical protein
MQYTLSGKYPLSPYSMFSVIPQTSKVDLPFSAQFRLINVVVIGENLIGLRGGNGFTDGYNPFDLYGAAERARGKALPPHLVFAELEKENPNDACAFLNAYGPLENTNSFLPLRGPKLREWQEASSMSPAPEEYFRSTFGEVPLLPHSPVPQDLFWDCPLSQFWSEQSEFELTLRLHSSLASGRDQFPKIRQALALVHEKWDIKGRNIEGQYVERAREFVRTKVNSHLRSMQPRIAKVPNRARITGVWGCYSLLEAMYLMLFLDIAGWTARITQCERCGSLFYTTLERTQYCSLLCENRARALRSYYRRRGGS